MAHKFDLHSIAHEIKSAQDQCRQLKPFTARLENFGPTEAYAVARQVHEMRMNEGAIPVGRKIGFTNLKMWEIYGVSEPIWGYVYDTTLMKLTHPEARCRIGRFAEPKIEPEVVLHFRSAPPMSDDVKEILACIDWIAHGIEIVQSHFPSWEFKAADTIADWGLHGALIVGEPQDITRLGPTVISDLEDFAITLSCDSDVREIGQGSNVLGSPLRAVAHLIAVIAKQPRALPLQPGELVTTGTLTAAFPIQAGQVWATNLEGIALPGISVSFEV